jgi:predicted xylose isomerase-like sugar epimerase
MSPRFALNGATTGSADLLTDIRVASEAGFEALEIRETKLVSYLKSGGALYSLRRTLADSGLEVLSINALEQSTLVSG